MGPLSPVLEDFHCQPAHMLLFLEKWKWGSSRWAQGEWRWQELVLTAATVCIISDVLGKQKIVVTSEHGYDPAIPRADRYAVISQSSQDDCKSQWNNFLLCAEEDASYTQVGSVRERDNPLFFSCFLNTW